MKKSLRNTLTGAVLAGTLSGCGLFGEGKASFKDPGDKEFIQKTFDEARDFWAKTV